MYSSPLKKSRGLSAREQKIYEYREIAESLDKDAIVVFTDDSRLEPIEKYKDLLAKPQSCGAVWVIYEHSKKIHKGSEALGDYDQNVGELTAIERSLEWLRDHRPGGDVHIFSDSDISCKALTDPGVHTRYYQLVQHARRTAAPLTARANFTMTLHWIPSHLNFGHKIAGNEVAGVLAGAAANEGRRQDYENPDKSLDTLLVHKCLRHEAAKLVHDIDKMFPHDDDDQDDHQHHHSQNGPTACPCAVPKVATAAGGKPGGLDGDDAI